MQEEITSFALRCTPLNENPLIARLVAGAVIDKLTSDNKEDEQLQQENAMMMTKFKNLATKKNFNTLKNKLTNKIKGQTLQKVKSVASVAKPKPPKPPKPKAEPTRSTSTGKQVIKKSTQELAKGILNALGGK